ncbi:DDE-type integrase/transposase/recombinase, partial [Myxococcota bacterium]
MANTENLTTAGSLFIKATLLAAKWAGAARRRGLESVASMSIDEKDKEIVFLRDQNEKLQMQVGILRKSANKNALSPRYTISERLHVLWFMEVFQIPRRKVTDYLGIARSTLYRWLHNIDDASPATSQPPNRTPNATAQLVWEIAMANMSWGRVRIANQLGLLGVFLAASTVTNILGRPMPPAASPSQTTKAKPEQVPLRAPAAFYPNHVWSMDTTAVLSWGLWPTQVFVAIDHFSRKVVSVCPLEGPNAGWVCNALDAAFERYGPPRHIISDRHPVFRGAAVKELLKKWRVKQRFGAVGKHGSIAVTERVIKTLKYEWLFRVPLIKGFDHLAGLCEHFCVWYNSFRPHSTLNRARPDDWYARELPEQVP